MAAKATSNKQNATKKRLVIVGGGFAGAYCARKLESDFETTLIDSKDYFEFTPSVLRVLVEPNTIRKIQAYHAEYLKQSTILLDCVTKIDKKQVHTRKGKKIAYDYLIIASGSSYNLPIKSQDVKRANRASELSKYHQQLLHAKRVLIVGGGIVGVELAAEIASIMPQIHVTIGHSGEEILNRNLPKTQKYCRRFLEDYGVEILCGEKILGNNGSTYHTQSGKKIVADLAFLCTGITPNSSFMKQEFKQKLDDRHFIKVRPTLQVAGLTNVFAVGDVTDIREEKTAQNAEKQAIIAVENIRRLHAKRQLQKYQSRKRPIDISLGKYDGVLEIGGRAITGCVAAVGKWLAEKKTMIHYGG